MRMNGNGGCKAARKNIIPDFSNLWAISNLHKIISHHGEREISPSKGHIHPLKQKTYFVAVDITAIYLLNK